MIKPKFIKNIQISIIKNVQNIYSMGQILKILMKLTKSYKMDLNVKMYYYNL